MDDQVAWVKARFDMGALTVIDRDPKLRQPFERAILPPYLGWMFEQGWKTTGATFDGYDLTVDLQRADNANKTVYYIMQTHQAAGGLMLLQKELLDELRQPMLHYGWKELACSKHLTDLTGGVWVVILWMKDLPWKTTPL